MLFEKERKKEGREGRKRERRKQGIDLVRFVVRFLLSLSLLCSLVLLIFIFWIQKERMEDEDRALHSAQCAL